MKKKLSFVLALLILSSSVISCSNNSAEDTSKETEAAVVSPVADESAVAEETAPEIADDLPEVNFDGSEFMIYNTNASTNTWFMTTYVDFEEDSAEALESSIYHRNAIVEERFGVVINETYSENSELTTHLTAGGDGVDFMLLTGANAASLMTKKMLYDIGSLENINLEKPYWDQNFVKYLSLVGKYYLGIGDFMTTHIDETMAMFFNKKIVEDYALESPYEIVDNYQWTYDKMYELGKNVLTDSNGDGVYNDSDKYALISHTGVMYPFLIFGSGETYVKKDENDIPSTAYYNERFVNSFENLLAVVHSEGDTFAYDARVSPNNSGLGDRVQEVMFANNQGLFWIECVSWSKALREMEADFGIIPSPMFNEEQAKYYNYVSSNLYGQCIPVTLVGDDLYRTTVIVEALNSSSEGVVNAYYDISLKGKHYRDEESGRMLDIIFSNRIYDISVTFAVASIGSSFQTMGAENNTDIASFYKRNDKMFKKLIDNLIESISE